MLQLQTALHDLWRSWLAKGHPAAVYNEGRTREVAANQPQLRPVEVVPSEPIGISESTKTWLNGLPSPARPIALCVHHPRLADRIAAHWPTPVRAAAVLDVLIMRRRGLRRSLTQEVVVEILRLRALLARDAGLARDVPGKVDVATAPDGPSSDSDVKNFRRRASDWAPTIPAALADATIAAAPS